MCMTILTLIQSFKINASRDIVHIIQISYQVTPISSKNLLTSEVQASDTAFEDLTTFQAGSKYLPQWNS